MYTFPSISGHKGLFYGADYNPEQWSPKVWREDVKLMKQAKVNVVSLAIFSWAIIQPSEKVWDFEWLDEVIDLLHSNDIAVDLGTATASPPPWLTTKHPEILPRHELDDVHWPGARQHWRPTSPIYRLYAEDLVTRLADRYADHPGVIAWHVNNELGCHNLLDFSDDAVKAFRVWLMKRYGAINMLNFSWGTTFWSQKYQNFDEIVPPRSPQSAATFANPTQQLDWKRFSSDALKDWLKFEVSLLHKHSPGKPVTTNYMLTSSMRRMDYASWGDDVDFISNDHYRVQSEEYEREDLSFTASWTSGLAGGTPWWLMEHSTSAVNWQPVNIAKRAHEMARDSLTHVAYGADAVCFFQWRQSVAGAEKYHSAMLPHTGPDTKMFRSVVELGKTLESLQHIRGSHSVTAPVAILMDSEAWMACELDSHPSSLVNYQKEALEWFVALLDLGIRVDVISVRNVDLSKYKFVIAPTLYLVQDNLIAKVQSLVQSGGHFFTTFFSGIVDENDHIRVGGYPGAWRDMLGIRVDEFAPLLGRDTVKLDDGSVGKQWTEPITITAKDVMVLQSYSNGNYAGGPASTTRPFGKGSASYLSTKLDVSAKGRLLSQLLSRAGIASELPASIRGLVEHVVRGNGHDTWTFLINRTDDALDVKEVSGDVILSTAGSQTGTLAPRGVVVIRRSQ